ncbi:MAG: hydantoinase B/oxoprolinase family protein [Ardenticatenaceae bacterium]
MIRELELLYHPTLTILSERRHHPPYGLAGGEPGQTGQNLLIRKGQVQQLAGKVSLNVQKGDMISVQTPGGGGYGDKRTRCPSLWK